MAGSKIYRFDEVVKHNSANDCWLIISGKVYDVTSFKAEHPGGREVLESATGRDAIADFEDVGHSPGARELMDQYCIGEIDPSTVPKETIYKKPQRAPKNPDDIPEIVIKVLPFIVPMMILGFSFTLRYLTK